MTISKEECKNLELGMSVVYVGGGYCEELSEGHEYVITAMDAYEEHEHKYKYGFKIVDDNYDGHWISEEDVIKFFSLAPMKELRAYFLGEVKP